MTLKSEEYRWSSAAAHCGLKEDSLLAPLPSSMDGVSQVRWSEWLALPESKAVTDIIQRNIEKGLPCGGDSFVDKLEAIAKRSLKYKPQGRPRKTIKG